VKNYQNKGVVSTQRVSIPSDYDLEGIVRENGKKGGVVICHPHPLYGGSMFNNVVEALEDGFGRKGSATLRFNFRGVEGSSGAYDKGDGEVADVLAAVRFLRGVVGSETPLMLAGYSFGAWVCTRAAPGAGALAGLFLVSYPFAFYDADPLFQFGGSIYFVGGSHDDIGPVDGLMNVYEALPGMDKHVKVIPTDHFYGGRSRELSDFIVEEVRFPA
jgi:alpha/beta superfamily hydrolase